ncbi:MAG: LamG-like jellyroll fold domain-containing protein, partial [Promethearchaeota archaeon]
MNMRNIGRGPRLLIALGLLFLALVLLPQTAYVQGPDPASPPSEAAPAATTAGCQDKVPGQKIKLLDEAEIVVSFRNQIGFLQAVQLGDTSGSLTKDGNWLHPLAIDVKWPSVTTADLNGDGAYESVCAYRDYNDRLAAFSLPEFHYMWYTDVGQQKGDIKYIDIAAGNLDRSAEGDDEVVIAFADDGHDIQLLALQGNPYGGLGNSPNHCYGQWWYAGSGYGRGDVSHVAVATGDLNGDGYDDEIVTAFKDGNKDLQVIVFKRPPGDSHLQVLYEKTWSTEYRGHIAKHGERGLDVTTGDLDQDLQDEIVIAFSDSGNQVQVLVLDYTGKSRGQYNFDDGTFTRFNAAVHTLYNDCPYFCASYEGWPYYLSAATGDIDRDGKDEIVVGYTSYHGVDQVSAWEGALVDARYPVVRTLEYAAAFPSSLTVKNSWYSRSSSADTYYSVRYMSVGAGDMNGDGKAEIVAAFRDKGKDLQVWAFNGNLTKRSSWEDRGELRETVEDIWVTVGDLDNDSLYGVYTGQCTSVTQAQVMAVAHTPPRWPWLQENPTLNASYGKSRTVATSDSQKVSDSYGGSLTMNAGFSIDVVDLGASTTFAWEESASRTWTEGTSRSVAVAQGSDMVTNDPVVFQEVTYYCYKYRQYVGNTPQAGAYSRVCIPTTSLQPRGPDLAKWNSSVGNEFPSSWVPLGRCSPRPDLVPTEVKDPNTSDGQFQVKINGVWHTVPGKILWTWGDLSGWGIPSEKLGAFQVGTGEGVASWEITTENIFSRDVEKTYKYNETIGGKASVLGIGAEGSVTWGFEKGSSHTVSWSDAFSMGGDVAGLPQGTVGKDYKYVPYLYKQTQESSTGIEQTYFVLDYYVTDPPPADPLNNGLVGWWKGDGQAVNEVGAPCACYGSLYGGMDYDTGFAAGKVGLAFKLDGTNDRVRVAHTDAFNVNRLTVAAWVKCNASPDTPDQGIVGKGDAWSLSRNTYADAAILRIAGAAVPGEVNSLGDDQWHHVVGAYDGSTVRLYVDGNLETSAPPPGTLPTNADDLWIGGRADCPQYGSCFNGLIDEVRLYNRALTAAEVQALYDAENSAASPAPAKGGDDPGLAPLPPVIDSPTHPDPATWYANRTATFTWAQPVGDPATVTGYRWYLDHAATTVPDPIHLGLTTTVTYQDLPDGLWYLHLRARGDGDEWGDTAHRALRIDVDPPQVTLALDPPAPTGNASWYNTPLTVTVVTTDGTGSGVAAVEVSTDGVTWTPYTAPLSFPTDTPTTTLWARATDVAGHVSTPVSATFKVDVTPPSSKVEIGGQTFGVYIAHVVTDTLGNQHLVLAGHITDTLSGRAGM